MHRLLLLLSVLGLVTRFGSPMDNSIDLISCPINYFGRIFVTAYVEIDPDSNLIICLDADTSSGQECLRSQVVDPGTGFTHTVETMPTVEMIAEYSNALPTISGLLQCLVIISFTNFGLSGDVTLASFGQRSAVSFLVPGSTVTMLNLNTGGSPFLPLSSVNSMRSFLEISQCLVGGLPRPPNSDITPVDPMTCMQKICDSNALIMDVSICSEQQMCNGGSCSYHPFCNVIGPGVIDFFGNTITVVDECTYTLLSHENIIISTKFGPRRRDGISFPDKVTISTPDQITGSLELSEDGTLLIGGAEPDDTNTPASVTISENDLGVTIEITGSGFKVVLFYNGQYIQIFITGGVAQMTTGLCRDSDSLSSSMSDLSLTGCMEVPDQDPDETIDALVVEKQCNVLSESILFPCFSISHTPYENLCNDILNIYPQLDGFNCPFQEAYARACELNGHTLGDWRSQISCDVHDVFCPDDTCVLDEFCGDTDNGVRGCRCRGSMTGLPATVCDGSAHTAVATLPTCQFTERGFDFTGLHLNDPTCVPKINNVAKIITFTMDDNDRCGAIITTNEFNEYIVKNTISNSNSGRRSAINTGDGVNIAFACVFEEPEVKTLSFTPVGNSINMELSFGEWLYTLTFDAFIDDAFTQPVGETIGLSSKIWVKIATTGLEGAMVAVLTESCWATSEASPDAGTRFDLITNGCGVTGDVVVDMTGNGMGISNSFCFRIFEFSDSPGNFYLHCQVRLCQNECIPSCGARRRRSNRMTLLNETLPIMSLVWSK